MLWTRTAPLPPFVPLPFCPNLLPSVLLPRVRFQFLEILSHSFSLWKPKSTLPSAAPLCLRKCVAATFAAGVRTLSCHSLARLPALLERRCPPGFVVCVSPNSPLSDLRFYSVDPRWGVCPRALSAVNCYTYIFRVLFRTTGSGLHCTAGMAFHSRPGSESFHSRPGSPAVAYYTQQVRLRALLFTRCSSWPVAISFLNCV